jgi:hypothetical protein
MKAALVFVMTSIGVPVIILQTPALYTAIQEDPMVVLYGMAACCLAAAVLIFKITFADPYFEQYIGHHPFEEELRWAGRGRVDSDAKEGQMTRNEKRSKSGKKKKKKR